MARNVTGAAGRPVRDRRTGPPREGDRYEHICSPVDHPARSWLRDPA